MKSYHLTWAVFLTYHHKIERLELHFTSPFQEKYHIDTKELVIEKEDIRSIIHKYDHRKFAYFGEMHHKTFDTQLRIRFCHTPYIKTQAICHQTPKGFECVLIEEKVLFETKRNLSKLHRNDVEISFNEHQDEKTRKDLSNFKQMKHQLQTFFERSAI